MPKPKREKQAEYAARPWHRYIDTKIRKGDYAEGIARDLWHDLNMQIDRGLELQASETARALCYLNTHWDARSAGDPFQGRR